MSQSWDIDPATGDYVMTGGRPKQTDSLTVPAYIRLKTPRRGWLHAGSTDFGSDLHKVKRRAGAETIIAETLAARALQPLTSDGRANEITVDAREVSRHGVGLKIDIVEATGKLSQLNIPSLGV